MKQPVLLVLFLLACWFIPVQAKPNSVPVLNTLEDFFRFENVEQLTSYFGAANVFTDLTYYGDPTKNGKPYLHSEVNFGTSHSVLVIWNNEGSFLNNAHKDLKADYILANPPFNDSDWSGELLQNDARWKVLGEKLVPPAGNANYAWIMHFFYHLAPTGQAGFVLSKGSLTTQTNNEGEIRKALIEKRLVDCIVNLPT